MVGATDDQQKAKFVDPGSLAPIDGQGNGGVKLTPETVHQAGISARGRVIPEDQVQDISERVVDWFA